MKLLNKLRDLRVERENHPTSHKFISESFNTAMYITEDLTANQCLYDDQVGLGAPSSEDILRLNLK